MLLLVLKDSIFERTEAKSLLYRESAHRPLCYHKLQLESPQYHYRTRSLFVTEFETAVRVNLLTTAVDEHVPLDDDVADGSEGVLQRTILRNFAERC